MRIFLLSLSLVVAVVLAVVFLLRERAVNSLLVETVRQEAESYANLIVVTRHWNSQYGGVYVEKRPGVESNAYLRQLGIEPDVRTQDGRVLTLRNPAIMTREISELAFSNNIVKFHLVSLKALNPENRPDAFEQDALERFTRGERDIWQIDRSSQPPLFRYVLPLVIERACLRCHAAQGYAIGDIRGGVSVMVPAGQLLQRMGTNRRRTAVDFAVTLLLLLGIGYALARHLAVRLEQARRKLEHTAVTDELTGLRNRRYIMGQLEKEYQRAVRTGAPLSLILFDIDHFKKVNDTYGHAFGDRVLQAAAREMEASLRSYDLLGRIGGEEFLIASPGSTLDDAARLAERIRRRIDETPLTDGQDTVRVTVSAGVTSLGEQDAKAEMLLARADEAMYLAKQEGRDRVVSL
jgi:diguanylate cyclase (GGDEF)-like protein